MSDTPDREEAMETATVKKRFPEGVVGGRKPGAKGLTVAQKAEAAALWRVGTVTLDDLAKRFKKRPETFSRLFKKMGIEKGSGAAAALKKAEAVASAKVVSDTEETLTRIAQVKDSHFKMISALSRMAFQEIANAKRAELDVGKLKDVMSVYKMATEVVGNSRKELFAILNVEKHDAAEELDDLPDLTVRELTQDEVSQLQASVDDTLDSDPGSEMMEADLDDDLGAP